MVLHPGATVQLGSRANQWETTLSSRKSPRLPLPSFLQFENPDALERGVVLSIPDSRHIPFEFNTNQVAEYYAKRGV
jgi:small subunit ribosomal protein S4